MGNILGIRCTDGEAQRLYAALNARTHLQPAKGAKANYPLLTQLINTRAAEAAKAAAAESNYGSDPHGESLLSYPKLSHPIPSPNVV